MYIPVKLNPPMKICPSVTAYPLIKLQSPAVRLPVKYILQ